MDWEKLIKGYFSSGIYTIEQVKVFVQKGKITEMQYQKITGQDYAV